MPSHDDEERAVFPEVDDEEDESDEVDDSEDDDDEDEDGEIEPSSATPPPSALVPDLVTMDPHHSTIRNPNTMHVAVSAAENGSVQVQPVVSDVATEDLTTQTSEERRVVPYQTGSYDDSRRLFQRLWTDEDELVILKGFLEFVSQRGTIEASHQHDTGPFYDKIKTQLQLEFSKNQLIEKLRRMKKKFRNVVSRIANSGKDFAFKTPHEQATFEIARQIWSSALKRSREISDDEILNVPVLGSGSEIKLEGGTVDVSRSRRRRRRHSAVNAGHTVGVPVEAAMSHTPLVLSSTAVPPIPSMIEETVRSCLSPLFKELIGSAAAGGAGMNLMMPMSFWGDCVAGVEPEDDKWRNQRILELEVYLKRVELVQDQIKKTLEELRSIGGVN